MLEFKENISLLPYNTLRIDVKARYFVKISTLEELQEFFKTPFFSMKKCILGGGANTLFMNNFEGIVIKISLKGIQKEENIDINLGKVHLKVNAGEDWQEFVRYCGENGYAGIENLAGIPGQVGTAPVSNIGAYGMEVKNCIYAVEGYNLENKEFKIFSHDECQFEYRGSIFKKQLSSKFLITAVTFELEKFSENYKFTLNYPDVQKKLEEKKIQESDLTLSGVSSLIEEIRNNKLPNPKEIGTAGSFFANPIIKKSEFSSLIENFPQLKFYPCEDAEKVKLSAGQLIDLAGMKGFQLGDAGVSEKHALILIHKEGNAENLLKVAELVQEKVFQMFNVKLIPEVVYVS